MADLTADAENPDLRILSSLPLTADERAVLWVIHFRVRGRGGAGLGGKDRCDRDSQYWPCMTVRLLDALDRAEADNARKDAAIRQAARAGAKHLRRFHPDYGCEIIDDLERVARGEVPTTFESDDGDGQPAAARDALADAPEPAG